MVTEKNAGSSHDFLTDPIRLLVEGDWLTADGTTLGADNGIGVSAALALLDCKFVANQSPLRPPLPRANALGFVRPGDTLPPPSGEST